MHSSERENLLHHLRKNGHPPRLGIPPWGLSTEHLKHIQVAQPMFRWAALRQARPRDVRGHVKGVEPHQRDPEGVEAGTVACEGNEGVVVRILNSASAGAANVAPTRLQVPERRAPLHKVRAGGDIGRTFEPEGERLEVGPCLCHPAKVGGGIGNEGTMQVQRHVAQGMQGEKRLEELRECPAGVSGTEIAALEFTRVY